MAQACADCGDLSASVVCCDVPLCLVHFHCTPHALHAERARVSSRAQARIDIAELAQAFQELTADLAAATRRRNALEAADPLAALAGAAVAPARSSGKRRRSSLAAPPAGPNVVDVRNPYARRKTRPRQSWVLDPAAGEPERPEEAPEQAQAQEPPEQAQEQPPPLVRAQSAPERPTDPRPRRRRVTQAQSEVGDPRDAARRMLGRALGGLGPAGAALAAAIEEAVLRRFGGEPSDAYRAHIRATYANLADESNELRARVASGALAPAELAALDAAGMSSAARAAERAETHERALRRARQVFGATASEDYTCALCGGQQTLTQEVGERRDIGKSETWGSKDAPEAVTRVICQGCGHEWKETA